MKKTSIVLIVGSVLLATGIVIGGIGFMMGGRRGFYADAAGFHAYDNMETVENTQTLEPFDNIALQFPAGNIQLVASDRYAIEYKIGEYVTIQRMEVQDGTLYVECENRSLQFFNFSIDDENQDRMTIYYPAGKEFNDLNMSIASGSITGSGLNAVTAELRQSSGDIRLDGFVGDMLNIRMTSGGTELRDVTVTNLSLQSASGWMHLTNCSVSEEIQVEMTSGKMNFENISAKRFVSQMSSGGFRLDGGTLGSFSGRQTSGTLDASGLDCGGIDYQSTSGNVKFEGELKGENTVRVTSGTVTLSTSLPESEYSYTFDASTGSQRVNGKSGESRMNPDAPHSILMKAGSGNLNLNFAE